jgi:hypothetical protein
MMSRDWKLLYWKSRSVLLERGLSWRFVKRMDRPFVMDIAAEALSLPQIRLLSAPPRSSVS